MDQSNEEYGRCIKCKQISTSLICQACNSNLKEREYGKCISCKQIKPINKEANYCHTCSSIYGEKKYGKCAECKQINSGKNWCHTCNSNKFQQNFSNWTSGSDDVDKFIQNNQLSARSHFQLLEWIPYDRFSEIVYIAKGGFGKIYRAYWKDGYISHWDATKHQWRRNKPNTYVALKILDRSQNLTLKLINEVTSHVKIFEDKSLNEFVRCYGISQDPSTKDYIMVMPYAKRGSLRNFLNDIKLNQKKFRYINFNLNFKIGILSNIAAGLRRIHEKGLIHRDLHIGNILSFMQTTCITDMGLCKPAYYDKLENTDNTVYGVLPYMAPEVIREGHYTQASDIYSFGIIMYETISKTPPYPDINHDEYLATEICKGLRPNFNIKVPQLIVYLIKRCLDANPSNRPNAKDLSRTINEWNIELNQYRNRQPELVESELIKQMLDINDNSSSTNISNLPFTHPGAIYASRPFKFNNLPEPKNSNNYYENCDNITEMIYSGELLKSNSECLECEIVN